jgi:hypothetical protein
LFERINQAAKGGKALQVIAMRDFEYEKDGTMERDFLIEDRSENDPDLKFTIVHMHTPYSWEKEKVKLPHKHNFKLITALNLRHTTTTPQAVGRANGLIGGSKTPRWSDGPR